ncbi:hypothetical protein ACFLRI_03460, partial [Bacteroidota bacterium]
MKNYSSLPTLLFAAFLIFSDYQVNAQCSANKPDYTIDLNNIENDFSSSHINTNQNYSMRERIHHLCFKIVKKLVQKKSRYQMEVISASESSIAQLSDPASNYKEIVVEEIEFIEAHYERNMNNSSAAYVEFLSPQISSVLDHTQADSEIRSTR